MNNQDRLLSYPLYWSAIGKLELHFGRLDVALVHFDPALDFAPNAGER